MDITLIELLFLILIVLDMVVKPGFQGSLQPGR